MSESATNATGLYMAQLRLDYKGLLRLGESHGFSLDTVDDGYLVHSLLRELFGSDFTFPFNIEHRSPDGGELTVLAYAGAPAEDLASRAKLTAQPIAFDVCDWEAVATKPMPSSFPGGLSLAFDLKAVPTIRAGSAGSGTFRGQQMSWAAGTTHDVYLYRQAQAEQSLDRESVYTDWLRRHFERRDLSLESSALQGYSIDDLSRRQKDRSFTVLQRPVATLRGVLSVTDATSFTEVLRSGIGPHTSFGFGMLRVRPVE